MEPFETIMGIVDFRAFIRELVIMELIKDTHLILINSSFEVVPIPVTNSFAQASPLELTFEDSIDFAVAFDFIKLILLLLPGSI